MSSGRPSSKGLGFDAYLFGAMESGGGDHVECGLAGKRLLSQIDSNVVIQVLNLLVDLVFIVDIVVNFRTSYYDK